MKRRKRGFEKELFEIKELDKEDLKEVLNFVNQASMLAFGEWKGNKEQWKDEFGYYIVDKCWDALYAKRSGKLISTMIYKSLPQTRSLAIGYMIVDRSFRNRGIGTAMWKCLEKKAKKSRLKLIFFDTSEELDDALIGFLRKNEIMFAKAPWLLPDEPVATYLAVKPVLGRRKYLEAGYLFNLYLEYLKTSYSNWEVLESSELIALEGECLKALEKVRLTSKRFMKYADEENKQYTPLELGIKRVRNFLGHFCGIS